MTHHPTITLPLMIAYSDALLPSLMKDNAQQTPDTTTPSKTPQDNEQLSMPLLWAVETNKEAEQLHQQLNKQAIKKVPDSTKSKNAQAHFETHFEIATLAQLNKQNIRQRYELGCFWLPTLTEEQLQQFIPTIMRYRDLYAAHLLIAIDDRLDLRPYGFTTFDIFEDKSLALQLAENNLGTDLLDTNSINTNSLDTESSDATDSDSKIALWQFNLYDYKRLPNWLNNKYWANPENWDKHRW